MTKSRYALSARQLLRHQTSPFCPQPRATFSHAYKLTNQVGDARAKKGRNALTSFLVVDGQSVKNTDSAEHKEYDAGKNVPEINREQALRFLPSPR